MPEVVTAPQRGTSAPQGNIVEMNWDPITRIVGSLGIFTKINFDTKKVVECYSTSSIFRGYSIFMIYLLIFGAGTIAGMMLITVAIATPITYSVNRFRAFNRYVGAAAGVLSLIFGLFLVYQIGYVDGLFR